jgi:hypothetical protein
LSSLFDICISQRLPPSSRPSSSPLLNQPMPHLLPHPLMGWCLVHRTPYLRGSLLMELSTDRFFSAISCTSNLAAEFRWKVWCIRRGTERRSSIRSAIASIFRETAVSPC